jgi:hypothetical protein
LHLEDGDIKGASAEIVDGDDGGLGTVETVCKCGSSGLVDYTENVETGDGTGVLGCLSLGVVKVGRDGDNGMAIAGVSRKLK